MSGLSLFCLPFAGGSASVFRDWSDGLPADIQVVPIELPGRGMRFREPAVDQLEPLVDEITATVRDHGSDRFALLGYSYGSMLAFEVALRLEHRYGLLPAHLVVAAMRAPTWPRPLVPVWALSDAQFQQRLRALGGTAPDLLAHADFMALMMPVLRADFAVADGYLHRGGTVLSCPLTVLGGTDDHSVSAESLAAWQDATTGPFDLHYLPGDHFFLRPSRDRLLALLAETVIDRHEPAFPAAVGPRPTKGAR